jgi:protein-S-isoprenylcysteine O-methyltransferase Ste14
MMNVKPTINQSNNESAVAEVSRGKLILRAIIFLTLPPALLFISAGRLDWGMAWVYLGLVIISSVFSRLMMARKYPDLVEERAHALEKDNTKPWDKILARLVAFLGPTVILIVAGLNIRFSWPPQISITLQLVAFMVVILAYLLAHWATMSNKFFSATVRIQTERGHTVVTGGPYQYVRHPGYTGGIVAHLATPLMLGSVWALIPGVLTAGLLVIRTALEDKMLHNELNGYQAYAADVPYRLLPGVW